MKKSLSSFTGMDSKQMSSVKGGYIYKKGPGGVTYVYDDDGNFLYVELE